MRTKILIAENERIVREGLKCLLELDKKIEVIAEAADGEQVVNLAREKKPDVVVLDISLPVRDGIEATERIRASVPGTCVLVLSAQTDGDAIARAFAAGAHGYVFKSAASGELREAIAAVAQGKRFIGTGVAERIIDGYLDERDNDNVLAGLTEQERQILQLIADGKSNSETALILHLSTRTVEAYRAKIMAHLNLENVAALVKFAIRHGLVSLD